MHAWLVLAPTLIGLYFVTGLINPLWGKVSGFPMHLVARTHPVYGPHPLGDALAFVIWSIITFAARVYLSDLLLNWINRWRDPLVVLWACSAFFVVPLDKLPIWLPNWPVWCACE